MEAASHYCQSQATPSLRIDKPPPCPHNILIILQLHPSHGASSSKPLPSFPSTFSILSSFYRNIFLFNQDEILCCPCPRWRHHRPRRGQPPPLWCMVVSLHCSEHGADPIKQICISNMLNIANTQFGCKPGDVVCYCTNADFGNGVRDCSTESCPSQADAAKVIAFGSAYCGGKFTSSFVETTRSLFTLDALASAGTTGGALPILTSALATLTNTDAPAPTATGTDPAGDASSALSSINSAAASLSESLASVASSLSASLASQASSIR